MTQRTVQVMTTYRTAEGRFRIGVEGEVVDVHPEFLERFDKYNKPQVAAPAPAAVSAEAEPEPDVVEEPSDSWTVPQLQAYAKAKEIDLGDATKKADTLATIQAATHEGD